MQQQVLKAAEPQTGLLTGTPAQLAGLIAGGWAFRHPPPHRCNFTPAGRHLRERLLDPVPDPSSSTTGPSGLAGLRRSDR
ncbi:hypothetical protein ABZW18_33760 [Streptomyces sp. NPDC004647]|uniref:hypothetical protein n=1 Tax=Streptomyces sp. NPDC004647 TaxID=3154671 RepID=UPI0033BA4699